MSECKVIRGTQKFSSFSLETIFSPISCFFYHHHVLLGAPYMSSKSKWLHCETILYSSFHCIVFSSCSLQAAGVYGFKNQDFSECQLCMCVFLKQILHLHKTWNMSHKYVVHLWNIYDVFFLSFWESLVSIHFYLVKERNLDFLLKRCFTLESKSYRVITTWGRVNDNSKWEISFLSYLIL